MDGRSVWFAGGLASMFVAFATSRAAQATAPTTTLKTSMRTTCAAVCADRVTRSRRPVPPAEFGSVRRTGSTIVTGRRGMPVHALLRPWIRLLRVRFGLSTPRQDSVSGWFRQARFMTPITTSPWRSGSMPLAGLWGQALRRRSTLIIRRLVKRASFEDHESTLRLWGRARR